MKLCLISVEIFAWGKFGGFGRSTRLLGRELARRGLEVSAVVPQRADQGTVETLDGITVYGFPMRWPFAMSAIFRRIDADVYHSQHQSFGTALALYCMPQRHHVVTFRDPKERADWWIEFNNPTRSKLRVAMNWLYEDGPGIRRAVRRANGRFAAADCLNERLQRIHGFTEPLDTLPTPIRIPLSVEKSPTPLVAYVGRWDRRKRPELFFQLAERFPNVRFVAAGISQDKTWEQSLRKRFGRLPNLDMRGFVDQFQSAELWELLGRSWLLVNTSLREGVPTSLLEALAHRCAVLSYVDPDNIATRFGYRAAQDDFAEGLAWLLQNDRWREKGLAGCCYVKENFDLEHAIDRHMEVYEALRRQ
jgi:glycosyltransferase involved in cell wall biosynthesis